MQDDFWYDFAITIFIPLLLLVLGYLIGRAREAAHLKSLEKREKIFQHVILTNRRKPPEDYTIQNAFLCTGSVVIASDYFKTFAASLKNLIGGHLHTMETLLIRARREALVRMAINAKARGANFVLNTRLETMMIRFSRKKVSVPMVEVIAYGTGVTLSPTEEQHPIDHVSNHPEC